MYFVGWVGEFFVVDDWCGLLLVGQVWFVGEFQFVLLVLDVYVDVLGVFLFGVEDCLGQRDMVVGQCFELVQLGNWVLDQCFYWYVWVYQFVYEGRVGVVFQQVVDQVWQQVFVCVDWGVDVYVVVVFFDYCVVQCVVYVVQVLEFEVVFFVVGGFGFVGQGEDGGYGVGVVVGELWVDYFVGVFVEQVVGVGQVGSVGVFFVGVDGVVIGVLYLVLFDFVVLVGIFYQVQWDVCVKFVVEQGQLYQYWQVVFGVGLDDQVEFVLVGDGWVVYQFFVEFEGQFQVIGFFGVDGDVDVQFVCVYCQFQDIGEQFVEYLFVLCYFVVWMQC